MNSIHVPVLVDKVVEFFNNENFKILVDGTFGGGGHTKALLKKFSKLCVIGIDQDEDAIKRGQSLIKTFEGRLKLYKSNFREIDKVLNLEGIDYVDGFIVDLGVSSDLLNDWERGFSFLGRGPLDMRMDKDLELSAYDVINTFSKERLADIFYRFGEERHSRKIAKTIVEYRRKKAIETTDELAGIIKNLSKGYHKIHAATKVFQALRIFVNDELGALEEFLKKSFMRLNKGGRVAVITFHSLEDRIVKNFFRQKKMGKEIEILTKKPIIPSFEEIKFNPRARSAKLRVAEKII